MKYNWYISNLDGDPGKRLGLNEPGDPIHNLINVSEMFHLDTKN